MNKEKIPCEECISLAICRLKSYRKLVFGCSDLLEILYDGGAVDATERNKNFSTNVKIIHKALNPIMWATNRVGEMTYVEQNIVKVYP